MPFCNLFMGRPSYYMYILVYMLQHLRAYNFCIYNPLNVLCLLYIIASCYGIFCPLQSVGMIKSAVWKSFAETLNC